MLFGRKTEEKVDKLYRFFSALIGLLIAKGLVTKEELDLAAQPILLLQSNSLEDYAEAIKLALAAQQSKAQQGQKDKAQPNIESTG